MNTIQESFKLKDKVKIVKGPKDVIGVIGRIGEIRKGVGGKKSYIIDYEIEGRDQWYSIQLDASGIRQVKESVSFKSFILESKYSTKVQSIAAEMLGGKVTRAPRASENEMRGAERVSHKFVDTHDGPWVLELFKKGDMQFVKANPPKDSQKSDGLVFFLAD